MPIPDTSVPFPFHSRYKAGLLKGRALLWLGLNPLVRFVRGFQFISPVKSLDLHLLQINVLKHPHLVKVRKGDETPTVEREGTLIEIQSGPNAPWGSTDILEPLSLSTEILG